MLSSTSAMPDIPEPPMPTKWMRWVRPYMSVPAPLVDGGARRGAALAPALEAAHDALGRIGPGEGARVCAHARQALPVAQPVRDLVREPLAGQLAVEDHGRGSAVHQIPG